MYIVFFFQAEDGIRDIGVTGVQTCALPILHSCIFFVVGSSSCGTWDAASAWSDEQCHVRAQDSNRRNTGPPAVERANLRSEEHTSELQSRQYLVCRLLLEKKNRNTPLTTIAQTYA